MTGGGAGAGWGTEKKPERQKNPRATKPRSK